MATPLTYNPLARRSAVVDKTDVTEKSSRNNWHLLLRRKRHADVLIMIMPALFQSRTARQLHGGNKGTAKELSETFHRPSRGFMCGRQVVEIVQALQFQLSID